ncbi:hypothetical protein NMG60_11016261 [Bertholletia excelsa]
MSSENYDPCFPDQPVVDQYLPIWASLPSSRSKPAFICVEDGPDGPTNSSTLTYSQLNESVQTISLRRGETVVVLCSPGFDLVEIIFGCQIAGLLAVPIFPPEPSFDSETHHHLVRVLSQTKPRAAIAHNDYIQLLIQNLTWIATEDIRNKAEETISSSLFSYKGCRPEEAYLVQYTSGATGIPKPVIVSAGSAAHNVRVARKAYDLVPGSVIVYWLPQYHDCGNVPRLWLELMTEYRATYTPVPSFTLPFVVKRGEISKGARSVNLGSLRNLIIINKPIYKAPIEKFVEVFSPFGLKPSCISPSYGLAGNCTFVSTSWWGYQNTASLPTYNKLLPSARLGSDGEGEIEIIVVNEATHEPVENGVEGEIWVSSPSNAYGNQVSPPFVRTGDRGVVVGEQRCLFVIGRYSDMLLENGRIHPHYIENAAYNSCPQFLRGGCLAAFELSQAIAVVAEMQRSEVEMRVLRRICEGIRKAVMNKEKVDVKLVVLVKSGCVPKTTSGKVQRWVAKDKVLMGKMNVMMQTNFTEAICDSASLGRKTKFASHAETNGKANVGHSQGC